jgi:hypothetical protein
VHEDNDVLGVFSLEDYNVFTSKGAFQGWGIFISGILGLLGVVYLVLPDKPAVPRTAPGGLLEEYGGPGAMSVGISLSLMISANSNRLHPMRNKYRPNADFILCGVRVV